VIVDFASFVESLDWEELVHVHDVRVEFDAADFNCVSSESGWSWQRQSRSWICKFRAFDFPLTVQAYDNWHVQVMVKCSMHPIPFSFNGLTRLTSVLGELKGQLSWTNVPNVADWTVTSWHYGRDSRSEVSGPAFNVTFRTWFKTLARIYVKRELKKVRVEEVQSSQRTIQDLFEEALNRDGMI